MVQSIDQSHLKALSEQLSMLRTRCQAWDKKITLTDNKSFRFEAHLFPKSSLTLTGYIEQLQATLATLNYASNKKMGNEMINYECEKFINQFSALLNIVNHLDVDKADIFYKRYSTEQEKVYQHLQRQYEYEKRLLKMINEENDLYEMAPTNHKATHKARISVLKERYQKCNEYTQSLEFKMETLINE